MVGVVRALEVHVEAMHGEERRRERFKRRLYKGHVVECACGLEV